MPSFREIKRARNTPYILILFCDVILYHTRSKSHCYENSWAIPTF